MTAAHTIDRKIELMLNAEGQRRLCQRDLLEIRREGPRATRQNSAQGSLQLCRLNRERVRNLAADMRALYMAVRA